MISGKNEYEVAALTLINCTSEEVTCYLSCSPLRTEGGSEIESQDFVCFRRAVYSESLLAGKVTDALPAQGQRPFVLPPGEPVQILLQVYSGSLEAGSYQGRIAWIPESRDRSFSIQSWPLRISVADLQIPDPVSFSALNWAYPKLSGITRDNLSEAAADLKCHYVNVFVVHSRNLPYPDQSGSRKGRLSYVDLDSLLDMNPSAQQYLLFLSFSDQWKDARRFGPEWMSHSWRQNYRAWLEDLVRHLHDRNIGYERFALYPFDESLSQNAYEVIHLTKQIDPRVQVFANSFGEGPRDFRRFQDLVDIWCLPEGIIRRHPDWIRAIRQFGKPVWIYGGTWPAKEQDPIEQYRLMPSRAFSHGASGAGFWVYADRVDNFLWDDTGTTKGFYGVVYGAHGTPYEAFGESIIPSRRWEAWRQGVEDYEYFFQLQKAISQLAVQDPQRVRPYESLPERLVSRMLAEGNNSSAINRVRREITQVLLEIRHWLEE